MHPRRGLSLRIVTIFLAIVVGGIVVFTFTRKTVNLVVPPPPTTAATTTTAPIASTEPAASKVPKNFLDVVRNINPDFPTTQPLDEPLELRDAAPIVLSDPVYLCPRSDLWITRPDAAPLASVLQTAYDDRDHVVNEKIVYAHWQSNDNGDYFPHLIVPSHEGYDLILPPPSRPNVRHLEAIPLPTLKRLPLPNRQYDFASAFSFNDRIILPTAIGVSVLHFDKDKITDDYQDLSPSPALPVSSSPVLLLDTRGLLAFLPNSGPAFRYIDNHWMPLGPAQGWPDKILHLIPLLDGSVLQILPQPGEKFEMRLAILDAPQINADHISSLVDDLSDPQDTKRNAAFDELSRYGSGLWPILEKLLPNQPPETKIRLQQILKNKITPTLGGFTVINNQLRILARYPGGGALFYADSGVTMNDTSDKPQLTPAAWLSALPGQPISLLSNHLTHDLTPDTAHLYTQNNEWIVSDEAHGPRRFTGYSLIPLLPKPLRHFSAFVGKDHSGRWLFQDPKSAIENQKSKIKNETTLILDPSLPDPTPKLPVWTYSVPQGIVGWDQNNWPVVKAGGAFAIEQAGFRTLTPKDQMFTTLTSSAVGAAAASPSSSPSTHPSTSPSTTQASLGPALLVTPDGTYYDGQTSLVLIMPTGNRIDWALPSTATGTLNPWLIPSPDGALFLYNQPGRIVKIRPHLSQPATSNQQLATSFVLEGTFAHKIPNAEKPTRIWLDPAGRIVIANANTLSILFPTGRIPRQTINIIPATELDEPEQ